MLKNFYNQSSLFSELTKKFTDNAETLLENDKDKYDFLLYQLFDGGKSYYVFPNIPIEQIAENLKFRFEKEQKTTINIHNFDKLSILSITPNKGIGKMFGILKPVSLLLYKEGSFLSYIFFNPDWFEKATTNANDFKINFINNLIFDNIEKFIFENLQSYAKNSNLLQLVDENNFFIDSLNDKFQQFILTQLQQGEVLLSWLKISSLKNFALNKDEDKELEWYFAMTNIETLLIGFDKNGNFSKTIDIQNRQIELKKGIRNVLSTDQYEWTSTVGNSSTFAKIVDCSNMHNEQKIRQIAIKNIENSKKDHKYFPFARFLFSFVNDITTGLSIFYVDFIENKEQAIAKYAENNILTVILQNLLNSPKAEESLTFWYNDWQPEIAKSIFLIKLLLESVQNNEQLQKLLPLHTLINQKINDQEKDVLSKILSDIQYVQHLITLEKHSDAEKIIQKDLKKLPEQKLAEVIPIEDENPTGKLSGQYVRVLLLDLLSHCVSDKEAEKVNLQIAQLQPLNIRNMTKIAASKDKEISEKGKILSEILSGNGISPVKEAKNFDTKQINNKQIEMLKHPLISQNGLLTSIVKWISSGKVIDYEYVKKLAEPFSPVKNKEIADIIADLLNLFNLGTLEVFIAHGEFSIGVRAFEDNPSFLIIGSEHLNPDSPYYLITNELRFLIANEIAFLYFHFTKLTSQDIWRGAMNKGTVVFDAITNAFTIAGIVASAAKYLSKVSIFTNLADRSEKATKILLNAEKLNKNSSGIMNVSVNFMNTFTKSKIKPNNSNQNELIVASRIMQMTADRVGLLMCNDPISAIRAMFLSSKEISVYLNQIDKYGLTKFAEATDEQGKYINQNFAIRIASMFSFWFSEEFETLQNSLIIKHK